MALIPFDPQCVYYDSDLKSLISAFDDMSRAFRLIKKRAERAQTQRIDKSYFDYVSKAQALDVVPQTFYDFRIDTIRLCIFRYRKFYYIYAIDCDLPFLSFNPDFKGVGRLYGHYKTWKDAIPDFVKSVSYVSSVYLGKISPDDIPF